MQRDNSITIRLSPAQVKAIRRIVQTFHDAPNIASLVGLGQEELTAARDALMHIPVIGQKIQS